MIFKGIFILFLTLPTTLPHIYPFLSCAVGSCIYFYGKFPVKCCFIFSYNKPLVLNSCCCYGIIWWSFSLSLSLPPFCFFLYCMYVCMYIHVIVYGYISFQLNCILFIFFFFLEIILQCSVVVVFSCFTMMFLYVVCILLLFILLFTFYSHTHVVLFIFCCNVCLLRTHWRGWFCKEGSEIVFMW